MEDMLNSLPSAACNPQARSWACWWDQARWGQWGRNEKCGGQRNFGDPSEMVMIQPPYRRFRWMNLHYLLQQNLGVEKGFFWRIFQAESGSFDGLGERGALEFWRQLFVLKDIETFHSGVLKCARTKKGLLTFGTLHVWTHRPWTPAGQETSKPRLCLTCLLKGRLLSDEHGLNRDMRCRTTTLLVGTFFLGGNFVMKIWKEGEEFNQRWHSLLLKKCQPASKYSRWYKWLFRPWALQFVMCSGVSRFSWALSFEIAHRVKKGCTLYRQYRIRMPVAYCT